MPLPDARCPRCGIDLDGAVDCPAGYPADCAMKAVPAGPVDATLRAAPRDDRARRLAVEAGAFAALELLGLLLSPLTIGSAGVLTSLLGMLYAGARDVQGGRFRLVPRAPGTRVVDLETGAAPSDGQAILRNLPLVLAWSLAALPDPLGLLGWLAVGFVLALDGALVVLRDDGRRLGDLWAGTAVVRDEDG